MRYVKRNVWYGDILIGSRIKQFRKIIGLKTKDFSSLIGISQGALSGLENEKSKPSADTLSSIVQHTDINPVWLLTGEGEPCCVPSRDSDEQKYRRVNECENKNTDKDSNVIEIQHMELVRGFQDKKRAKKINEILIEIEHLRPIALKDIENYLTGVANGLRMAVGQDHYTGGERRSGDRRKNDGTGTGPGGKDRRNGTDRRKTGT